MIHPEESAPRRGCGPLAMGRMDDGGAGRAGEGRERKRWQAQSMSRRRTSAAVFKFSLRLSFGITPVVCVILLAGE
eukprot:55930-Rhodomonas_salina.1